MDNVALTEENKAVEMKKVSKFHRNLVKKGQLGRQGSVLYHTWIRENQTLSQPIGLPTVLSARRKRQQVRIAKIPDQIQLAHDINDSEQRQLDEENGIEENGDEENGIETRKMESIGYNVSSAQNGANCHKVSMKRRCQTSGIVT